MRRPETGKPIALRRSSVRSRSAPPLLTISATTTQPSRPDPAFPALGRECLVPRLVRSGIRFRSIHIGQSTRRRNFVPRLTMDLTNRISRSNRRTTSRPDADHREVGAHGNVSTGEGTRLRPSDSVRPRRGSRSDRDANRFPAEASAAEQDIAVTRAARPYRTRGRVVGLTYDPKTQRARLSAYVPGSGGRERKRETVFAATYDDATRLWTAPGGYRRRRNDAR
jgi:hypothetical protein